MKLHKIFLVMLIVLYPVGAFAENIDPNVGGLGTKAATCETLPHKAVENETSPAKLVGADQQFGIAFFAFRRKIMGNCDGYGCEIGIDAIRNHNLKLNLGPVQRFWEIDEHPQVVVGTDTDARYR